MHAPVRIGLATHHEGEFAALHQFVAVEPAVRQGFPVEGGRLHVHVLGGVVVSLDEELLAVAQPDGGPVEDGAAQLDYRP